MNKKIIAGFTIGIILIIGFLGVFFNIKKTKTINDINEKTSTEQKRSVVTQPMLVDNNVLKSCANNEICDDGYICYHSQYSGMGPNGIVNGEEEGDSLCHKLCTNDNECGIGICKTVELLGGDIVNTVKFCSENKK